MLTSTLVFHSSANPIDMTPPMVNSDNVKIGSVNIGLIFGLTGHLNQWEKMWTRNKLDLSGLGVLVVMARIETTTAAMFTIDTLFHWIISPRIVSFANDDVMKLILIKWIEVKNDEHLAIECTQHIGQVINSVVIFSQCDQMVRDGWMNKRGRRERDNRRDSGCAKHQWLNQRYRLP